MARTIQEIQNTIIASVQAEPVLAAILTSTSKTAIWRLTTYIVAVCVWMLEKLFDTHKADVERYISNKSPHRELWYKDKALLFQFGYTLPPDTDIYETIDTDAQIIKHATANEAVTENDSVLTIKVAKDNAGSLAELSVEEKAAFTTYMQRIKDAGVKLRIVSQEADHLRLVLECHYDPLVLNSSGERLDGTNNTPVQDAINSYLEVLPFNGEFTIMALTDVLQIVDGIKIPQVLSAEAKWGAFEWEIITAKYIPEAGWLKVYDGDITINWIAYGSDL
jgi:hypothetical protein